MVALVNGRYEMIRNVRVQYDYEYDMAFNFIVGEISKFKNTFEIK